MAGNPPWSHPSPPMGAWDEPTSPNPMIGEYSTGDGAGEREVLAINNAALASDVSPSEPRRTAFHRGAMGAAEALGARLSISPSDKIPQNDPASGYTQSNTRLVKSRVGRSAEDFQQGIAESGW